MITEDLLAYIKKQLENGHSEETVRKILIDHKWKQEDVVQAFSIALGANPQNNQANVASIMRPGFSGQQANSPVYAQPQTGQYQQQQYQPQQFQSQPQYQPQPQYQQPQQNFPNQDNQSFVQHPKPIEPERPQQVFQPQPQFQQPQQYQPQQPQYQQPQQNFQPQQYQQQPQQFQTQPQFQPQQPMRAYAQPTQDSIQNPEPAQRALEVKQEGPVFTPKTFNPKPFVQNQIASPEIQNQPVTQPSVVNQEDKKVQFGAVIQPQDVVLRNVEPKISEDAGSDFYSSLTTNTTEIPVEKKAEVKKVENEEPSVRAPGQPLLRPKTFGQKTSDSFQAQVREFEPLSYGKFATPEANQAGIRPAIVPVGAMPSSLYKKNRPEIETIKNSQNSLPAQMASQFNPNITERSITETPKSSSKGFFGKTIIVLLSIVTLAVGAYAYFVFFQPQIIKDSKFGSNLQNISSAEFEINVAGSILSAMFPSSEDPNLLKAKMKAFVDVSGSSNKISSFEITSPKGVNFNIMSQSTFSSIFTDDESFSRKGQWLNVSGPFSQSFLPSLFAGRLPDGLLGENGEPVSGEILQKTRELFGQFQMLNLTYNKGVEQINGKEMNTYSFVLDKTAINLYLDEVRVLAQGSSGYEEAISGIKNLVNSIEVSDGTIWIGLDGLPYKIMATVNTVGNTATSQINIDINSYNEKRNISTQNQTGESSGSTQNVSKDSIRAIFVELQSMSGEYKTSTGGSFTGVCRDESSSFFRKIKQLESISSGVMPICKDGSSGFLVGVRYAEGKYLCVDTTKITETDLSGITSAGLACTSAKQSSSIEDDYTKETISAFANIAQSYKNGNQNSFGGLCSSQNYLIFSRGLESAVGKKVECLSTETGYSVFSKLFSGQYACMDASAKYLTVESPRTTASCK